MGVVSKNVKDFALPPIEKQKLLRKDPKYVVSKHFLMPESNPN